MKEIVEKNIKQFVTCYINNQTFGFDIRLINEVNPNVNIIPIPLVEYFVVGHVNVRGQVVLILDLMFMFGKKDLK